MTILLQLTLIYNVSSNTYIDRHSYGIDEKIPKIFVGDI